MYVCTYASTYQLTRIHAYGFLHAFVCVQWQGGQSSTNCETSPSKAAAIDRQPQQKKTEPDEIYNPAHPTIKYPTHSFRS